MTQFAPNLRYPIAPTVEGALTREQLVDRARQDPGLELAMGPISRRALDDYDMLSLALAIGHNACVRQCIVSGASIVSSEPLDENTSTVLYLVARLYHNDPHSGSAARGTQQQGIEYLKTLWEHCPHNNYEWMNNVLAVMLYDCVGLGSWEMARYLLSHRQYNIDQSPQFIQPNRARDRNILHALTHAPDPGREEFIEFLSNRCQLAPLLEGVDSDFKTPLMLATYHNDETTFKYYFQWKANVFASDLSQNGLLHQATQCADIKRGIAMLKQYLSADDFQTLTHNYNDTGYLPIHEVVGYRDKEKNIMDWMQLAPDGNLNVFTNTTKDVDSVGSASPLGLAFSLGDVHAAIDLIRTGASLDQLTPAGHTAWHLVADLSASNHLSDIRATRHMLRLLKILKVSPEKEVEGISPYAVPGISEAFRVALSQYRREALSALQTQRPESKPRAHKM